MPKAKKKKMKMASGEARIEGAVAGRRSMGMGGLTVGRKKKKPKKV